MHPMTPPADIAPHLLARARSDQVVTLYGQWHRTTLSMVLGAVILCTVLWGEATPAFMACWLAAILANQAWRGVLARAFHQRRPGLDASARWGRWWSLGSTIAGSLWGVAAVALYPASPAHEALLIVCLFGVVIGGLNLTAVYKPSFYGFVLPALLPLIVRVAWEVDTVHLFTAIVMTVVLAFLLAFGHHLNDVLTHSLAIRHENVDLIAELQAQTRAALDARAIAETANRAKSQFLAAASHDLRQPLHAMGLFAAALATKAREPELKPLVSSIHASVDALEALFGQLLDLSRLDAGVLAQARDDVPLQPLLSKLRDEFAPQAAAEGLALAVVGTTATVDSDPLLLERILRNLVANALRYTRNGGVVVGVRRRGDGLRIDVIDSGIGIAPEMRDRIFDEFVQGDPAPRRHSGGRGMGLGLAIVRRLAALLGHRLEVASQPGCGSRFSVHLARAPARRRRHDPPLPRPAGTRLADGSTTLAGRTVAVIDDDPAVVAAMRVLFTAWGATVAGGGHVDTVLRELAALAADGRPPDAASDAAGIGADARHRGRPDLIVADLRLADDVCGLDAVAALRAATRAAVPALIVSGDTGDGARAAVARAGLTLLPKPVVASALQRAVAAALDAAAESGEWTKEWTKERTKERTKDGRRHEAPAPGAARTR